MQPRRIVFYDGECNFCHWTVRLVARWGRAEAGLFFAPLQGKTAAEARRTHPTIPADDDAIVFLRDGEVLLGPEAVYAIASTCRPPVRWFAWLRWLPSGLSWWGYRLLARYRFRLFGRATAACVLPTPELRAAQLD